MAPFPLVLSGYEGSVNSSRSAVAGQSVSQSSGELMVLGVAAWRCFW